MLLALLTSLATTLLPFSSNCNYAVGSGVTSICAKTCWRLQQKLYSKRCLAESSQFRLAGVGKWLTGTRCFGLAKKKLHFHSTKWSKKRTPWNCHEKEPKKRLKCAEISRLMHFLSKRLFTNVNVATRGFRSGGLFVSCYFCLQETWVSRVPHEVIVVFLTTDWRNLNLTRQAPMGWFTPAPIHRIIMALKGRMAPDALGLGDCMASNVV